MTRVDLDLAFNYDVRHSDDGDRFAGIKDRDVPAESVYVDAREQGCLLGVQNNQTSISIGIGSSEIPALIEELEKNAPEDYES